MNLLVLPSGKIIAAGPYSETATALTFADQVVPKSAVPGWAIVDMAVPAGFTPQTYTLVDGVLVRIPVAGPPAVAEDGYRGLMERRIAELEMAGDKLGGLALRVELLQKERS